MLVHHLTDWYAGNARQHLPGWETFVVTDVAAVAFTMAAGASGVLFATALARKGWAGWRIDLTTVRRYGLLVPIGMLLYWVLWRYPLGWGVLQVLGAAIVVSTLVGRRLPAWVLAALGAAAVALSSEVVEVVNDDGNWVDRVFGVGFPLLVYVGLALLGAAAGRLLLDRPDLARAALVVGTALLVVTAALALAGRPPQRHPGTLVDFAVPGIGGTLLLYALAGRQPPALLDRVLQRAGRHTFGIFLGHYTIYWALREAGLLGDVPAGLGVGLAVATTVAIVLVAPRVPQPPWTPRAGWRRQPAPKTSASTSGTGRSSWA